MNFISKHRGPLALFTVMTLPFIASLFCFASGSTRLDRIEAQLEGVVLKGNRIAVAAIAEKEIEGRTKIALDTITIEEEGQLEHPHLKAGLDVAFVVEDGGARLSRPARLSFDTLKEWLVRFETVEIDGVALERTPFDVKRLYIEGGKPLLVDLELRRVK